MTWLMLQSEIDLIDSLMAASADVVSLSTSFGHAQPDLVMEKGGIATIEIKGPLMSEPNPILDFFGKRYTVYKDIQAQSLEAVARKANRVDYLMETPGGMLEGLGATMDIIRNLPVKTRAIANNTLASAGYMLASQMGTIQARDELMMVGGFGVAGPLKGEGLEVSNTASPKKRPGKEQEAAVVKETLDDIYSIIEEKVSAGRKTTVEHIRENYGQGAVMTARTALSKHMIDSIATSANITPIASKKAVATLGESMNLDELKLAEPAVYAQAVAEGVTQERGRVNAHLVLAQASGDFPAAVTAIQAGDGLTPEVQAQHMAAAMKRGMVQQRGEEQPGAAPMTPEAEMVTAITEHKSTLEQNCPGLIWVVQ